VRDLRLGRGGSENEADAPAAPCIEDGRRKPTTILQSRRFRVSGRHRARLHRTDHQPRGLSGNTGAPWLLAQTPLSALPLERKPESSLGCGSDKRPPTPATWEVARRRRARSKNSWDQAYKGGLGRRAWLLLRHGDQTLSHRLPGSRSGAAGKIRACGDSSPARPTLRLTTHRHRAPADWRVGGGLRGAIVRQFCRAAGLGPGLIERAAGYLREELDVFHPKPRFLTENASMSGNAIY